jgi:hypothetical protein
LGSFPAGEGFWEFSGWRGFLVVLRLEKIWVVLRLERVFVGV